MTNQNESASFYSFDYPAAKTHVFEMVKNRSRKFHQKRINMDEIDASSWQKPLKTY